MKLPSPLGNFSVSLRNLFPGSEIILRQCLLHQDSSLRTKEEAVPRFSRCAHYLLCFPRPFSFPRWRKNPRKIFTKLKVFYYFIKGNSLPLFATLLVKLYFLHRGFPLGVTTKFFCFLWHNTWGVLVAGRETTRRERHVGTAWGWGEKGK